MPRKTRRRASRLCQSFDARAVVARFCCRPAVHAGVFDAVRLREAGVRETIGYASLIGLAYAFKWVWSPLLDQWRLPLWALAAAVRGWCSRSR
jgi:PAT family beta-lactamase induction signal transducer AmpG